MKPNTPPQKNTVKVKLVGGPMNGQTDGAIIGSEARAYVLQDGYRYFYYPPERGEIDENTTELHYVSARPALTHVQGLF